MLACWVLVSLCCSVAVLGELCEFPADHPIQDLAAGETVPVQVMENNRVYVYTNQFGDCHGCVRALNFCYKPRSDEFMTVEIRSAGTNHVTHTVTVNSTNDRINCVQRYSLGHTDCCVEQTPTEPFVVASQNRHYALRIGNTPTLLLRHSTETVAGEWVDHDGITMSGPLYKPLFYFIIDPSDGDCSSIPTTASPTPNTTTLSDSTTDTERTTENIAMSTAERTMTLLTASFTDAAPHSTMMTSSPPTVSAEQGSRGHRVSIIVGVAVGVVALIAAALVLISLTVCLRRRKKKRELLITAENMAYHSSSGQLTLTKEPSTEEYSYVSTQLHGGGGVATSANEAYGVRLGGEVAESVGCGAGGNEEVELSGNVAYTATGGGGAGEGENYDYVTRSDVLITATPNEAYGTNSNVSVSTNQAYGLVQS